MIIINWLAICLCMALERFGIYREYGHNELMAISGLSAGRYCGDRFFDIALPSFSVRESYYDFGEGPRWHQLHLLWRQDLGFMFRYELSES